MEEFSGKLFFAPGKIFRKIFWRLTHWRKFFWKNFLVLTPSP
jgi:hypothetical protein